MDYGTQYVYEVVAEANGKALVWWCDYNELTDFSWMVPSEIENSLLSDFRNDPDIQKRAPAIQKAYTFLTTPQTSKKWKEKRLSLEMPYIRSAFPSLDLHFVPTNKPRNETNTSLIARIGQHYNHKFGITDRDTVNDTLTALGYSLTLI
jgi:hypothetical protein